MSEDFEYKRIHIDQELVNKYYQAISDQIQPVDSIEKYAHIMLAIATITAELMYNCLPGESAGILQFKEFVERIMECMKAMYDGDTKIKKQETRQ